MEGKRETLTFEGIFPWHQECPWWEEATQGTQGTGPTISSPRFLEQLDALNPTAPNALPLCAGLSLAHCSPQENSAIPVS